MLAEVSSTMVFTPSRLYYICGMDVTDPTHSTIILITISGVQMGIATTAAFDRTIAS